MPCLCAWTGTAGGRVGAPQVRSRCEHVLHEFLALLSALGFKVDEVGCELASAPPCMLAPASCPPCLLARAPRPPGLARVSVPT
jgi:hypothetical protein